MRRIDEVHTAEPTVGAWRTGAVLGHEGVRASRVREMRLMRLMCVAALSPKPATSVKADGRKVFPYLLRGLHITEPNQVWCADITYIPMHGEFMYLAAFMDWATRLVLAWHLLNCMEM